MKKIDAQELKQAKVQAINVRQADSFELRAWLKAKNRYKPGMTGSEMKALVGSLQLNDEDVAKIDNPDRVQVHRIRRAIYAYERSHKTEINLEGANKHLRATFSDFSDKGFSQALKAIRL